MRFNSKLGAGALVALAAVYLVVSVASGRSARAEVPPDLSPRAADSALDVWKTATLLVQEPRTAVVDVRPADAYARYHLPGAVSVPGATVDQVRAALREAPAGVIVAAKDEAAQELVAAVRLADPSARVHYLADGARAWYLAFQLPVPLFSDASPPSAYDASMAVVTEWIQSRASTSSRQPPKERTLAALQTLAKVGYQPNLLQGAKKSAATGGKKKLSGGCG